jgi:flagellar protein FlaG
MTANVQNIGATPDPTLGTATATAATPGTATPASPRAADLRLVIEEDAAAGCFVYKTVDWRTGAVVQQLPREQLVKLREAENYTAGAVVSTRA